MPAIGPDSPNPRAQSIGAPQQMRATGGMGSPADQASALQGLFGPQLALGQAGYNQQLDALQQQASLYGANQDYQSGLINQNLQNTLAGYDLQNTGLQQQQAYQQGQYGLQQQGFGLQQQAIDKNWDFMNQGYDISFGQLGLQGQGLDIQGAGLADQLKQAQYNYGQQVKGAQQGAAGAGVYTTQGTRDTMANLAQQEGYQERGIGRSEQQLGLSRQNLGFENQRLNLGLQQQAFGLNQQQGGLNISEQQAANTENYQMQQITNAFKSLGMNEQQARNAAQQQLAQLTLNNQLGRQQTLGQIGQLEAGQAGNVLGSIPGLLSLLGG